MSQSHSRNHPIVRELVIGFGFLNGLWFAIGTSPQQEILNFVSKYSSSYPDYIQKLLIATPIILTIITVITLISVYRKGGITGSLAVLVAFASGSLILKEWKVALIMLAIAFLMGLVVFRDKRH